MLALADMLNAAESTDVDRLADPLAPRKPEFAARAKSVIWIFLDGAASTNIDMFDRKPELDKRHGKRLGETVDVLFGNPGPVMRSPYEFKQYGKSGMWVSELMRHTAEHVDELTFLKACVADSNNHGPALLQMNSGFTRVGYPSAGSWITYGLGSENRNLPGYVVLYDPRGVPINGSPNWSNGFLPAAYQGVQFRSTKTPVLYLDRPGDMAPERQRAQLDLLQELNKAHREKHAEESELDGRIKSFELAYRMQMEAPEAVDVTQEKPATHTLYGMDNPVTESVGRRLLIARRLVERGVRFVQVYAGGWDAHTDLEGNHRSHASEVDLPTAGFLTDMRQRGLLKDTLVIWGSEFGRMPLSQDGTGRDHNPHAFLLWMVGGGLKPGYHHGESDDLGYKPVSGAVTIPDFHATLLHILGLNHKHLTYRHNGRSFRLTDVSGEVVKEILA
jgi:hypothetical protein